MQSRAAAAQEQRLRRGICCAWCVGGFVQHGWGTLLAPPGKHEGGLVMDLAFGGYLWAQRALSTGPTARLLQCRHTIAVARMVRLLDF